MLPKPPTESQDFDEKFPVDVQLLPCNPKLHEVYRSVPRHQLLEWIKRHRPASHRFWTVVVASELDRMKSLTALPAEREIMCQGAAGLVELAARIKKHDAWFEYNFGAIADEAGFALEPAVLGHQKRTVENGKLSRSAGLRSSGAQVTMGDPSQAEERSPLIEKSTSTAPPPILHDQANFQTWRDFANRPSTPEWLADYSVCSNRHWSGIASRSNLAMAMLTVPSQREQGMDLARACVDVATRYRRLDAEFVVLYGPIPPVMDAASASSKSALLVAQAAPAQVKRRRTREKKPPQSVESIEQHFRPVQLAARSGFSEDVIRDMFRDQPGVLELDHPETRTKRRYRSMSIPASVAERVFRERSSRRKSD
jgi:hypothetical protein